MDTGSTNFLPPPALNARNGGKPFVLIDGFNLSLDKGTGVATYSRNLSYALRDLGCDVGVLYGYPFSDRYPPLLQEVMFFDAPHQSIHPLKRLARNARALVRGKTSKAFSVPINGTVITEPLGSRLPYYDSVWNAANLYTRAFARFDVFGRVQAVKLDRRPELVHWTYPLPLYVPGVPNVYTLHDLVPLRLPYTTLDKKERYLRLLKWICKNAAHIVTVSENSKRDIVDILGVNSNRVTNTYQAVNIPEEHRLKPEEVVRSEIEGTFGLSFKEYFLYFGSIEPKKNIGRLVEGYLASGVKSPLVMVGAQAWKAEKELRLIDQLQKHQLSAGAGRIIRIEYLPFASLVNMIRGAKAVLFPSLYEGFGLPALESMLLGTPVLTSNTSSLPEIVGSSAALTVDPYNVRSIAEGISALDTDPSLRAALTAQGLRRAASFSHEEYANRLAHAYKRARATDAA